MRKILYATCLICYWASAVSAQSTEKPNATELTVPEKKQTELGLYVTASGAYKMWQADKDGVKVLDVRTAEEYVFVGHAPMARNIPLMFVTRRWDAEKEMPALKPNPEFLALVKENYKPTDTILITCRSGGRSKKAVDLLAKEGYTKVYNIIDGMEGDPVKDPESVFDGKRMKNGWKNSGAPWTYKLKPALMYLEATE